MVRLIQACLILLVAFSSLANAQETDNDQGYLLVQNFLESVQTMSGKFEQQLIDADDIVVEESSGTLDIRRPGQFRWSYIEPYPQMLIADGRNIWSYDVDLEQVTVKNQGDALGSTPAILLGGSADVLEDFNYIGSFEDRGTVWVRLRPKNTDNGFNKVELGFTDGDLTRMLFADNLEQTTLIALFDVTFNAPLEPGFFEFEPPAGVDVVGEPIPEPIADL